MTTSRTDLARAAAGSLARALREQQRLGGGRVDAATLARVEAATGALEASLAAAPAPTKAPVASDARRAEAAPRTGASSHEPAHPRDAARRGDAAAASAPAASVPTESETKSPSAPPASHASPASASSEAAASKDTAAPTGAPAPGAAQNGSGSATPAVDTTPMLDLPWVPKSRASRPEPAAAAASESVLADVERPTLDAIREALGPCERCGLCTTRTNIVFGVGSPTARLMFIGEAPGRDEDAQGEPFVGRAGELLTRMIGAMGLSRDDVYIANVIKCRPPDNRDPAPDEIAACEPFVLRQIDSVQPEVIVTLGRVALQAMTKQKLSIMRTRGQWLDVRGVPTMPTMHPAFLLRKPEFKREAWSDLQQVMQRLGLEGTR